MAYWKIHDKQIVLGVSPMFFRIFAGYINSHSNQISCWLNPSSPSCDTTKVCPNPCSEDVVGRGGRGAEAL
jgi:hypothetical protein